MFILHSGQSGVERGAHRAAVAMGVGIKGFCQAHGKDEIGLLPEDIGKVLVPCSSAGARKAIEANLEIATGMIVVVPDPLQAGLETGIAGLLRKARARMLPNLIVGPGSDPREMHGWLESQLRHGEPRILVTGPRATRWADGDRVAFRLISAMLGEGRSPLVV